MSIRHLLLAARQRVHDWRHERLIQRHVDACKAAIEAGNKPLAREHYAAMAEAIKARSPERVARMERRWMARMDPRDRAAIERSIGEVRDA